MSKTHDTVRIFDESRGIKPEHYPELKEYKEAIYQSYWTADEFNFSGDVQDYRVEATDAQRSIIRKTMLAISQIEVKVKTFWGDIHETLPHTSIGAVGSTFAESEVRHMDAYKELLEELGLEDEFANLSEVPAIQGRIDYLEDCMRGTDSNDKREFARSVLLFSTFVEHVSLFSQFLIMTSFDRHEKMFTKISNAVSATSKEEQIHGLFGQELVRTIQSEYPDLFDEEFDAEVQEACEAAYEAEMGILDWIFEDGELDFLPREQIDAFLKHRFNQSLDAVDVEPVFEPDEELVDETQWFRVQMKTTRDGDFFAKTATTYTKHTQDVSADQMF
jgi:ribonucleoside-diphosphate reductase beta chain